MCGILGIAGLHGRHRSVTTDQAIAMRDRMAHRGPDGQGCFEDQSVILCHRRLAIIDPDGGHQPLEVSATSQRTGGVLVYNGELYNSAELRHILEAEGERFDSHCDSEIVGKALARWGQKALDRFRGMFALAWYDPNEHSLLLARDPLGIKPLYYATIETPRGPEFVFASEISPILMHPHCAIQPDWVTVSAYLSTIRTTLGNRTMFAGIETLRPGECMTVQFDTDAHTLSRRRWWSTPAVSSQDAPDDDTVRGWMHDTVEAHMVSDVPVAGLLSGGLDSAIITHEAVGIRNSHNAEQLRTFCIGHLDDVGGREDFAHARLMAQQCKTSHHEVELSRADFDNVWPWMIAEHATPLSTPNEIAIYAIARAVSEHAPVVLTGEGADELFAGYGPILESTAHHLAHVGNAMDNSSAASFYIDATSWIPRSLKPQILTQAVRNQTLDDAELQSTVENMFHDVQHIDSWMDRHARVQGQVNLAGLLARLDSATMLASVEGRTPFADVNIAQHAMSIATETHASFASTAALRDGTGASQSAPTNGTQTKRLLRHAYASTLPASVLTRPKQSFPLPFQQWMGSAVAASQHSDAVRQVFSPDAIATVVQQPIQQWNLTWPMTNIMIWLRTFFD